METAQYDVLLKYYDLLCHAARIICGIISLVYVDLVYPITFCFFPQGDRTKTVYPSPPSLGKVLNIARIRLDCKMKPFTLTNVVITILVAFN